MRMYTYELTFNLVGDNHIANFHSIKTALEYAIYLYNAGATIYSLKRVVIPT